MPNSNKRQTYRASWIWAQRGRLLPGAAVVIEQGRIAEVIEHPGHSLSAVDLGHGLITPGLVNAHTHLELSGLKGLAEPNGDFVDWLLELVATRPNQDPEFAAKATQAAAAQAAASGTVLVGDVTNTGHARDALAQAGLSAVYFFEALGSAMAEPPEPYARWVAGRWEQSAMAAHSPYSVPAWRMAALKQRAGDAPFAIHIAESIAEMEYVAGTGEQGDRLAAFLEARGVRRDKLGLHAARPLAHVMATGAVDGNTLLVHGVQLEPDEAAQVAASGASLCVCPRSNLGLTKSTAPVEALLAAGVNLALGTDSLASNVDLNLFNEMSVLAATLPRLDPEAIFHMATMGGARALGLADHFGCLAEGCLGAPAFVPLGNVGQREVLSAALEPQAAAQARSLASP